MTFAGVKIVTVSEGEITHLHVGLKGTMNALFLKDLADKVRRGLRGRVEAGKAGGGNSYGYDVVKQFALDGEPVRGDRKINEAEAAVVRRIFRDYAAGKSPKRIASELNSERIAAPGGGEWGFSTINGNAKRANGILHNELYIGRLVWNRQRFIKDTDTGKRVSRLNSREEWIVQEVPELRILDNELWEAARARQKTLKQRRDTGQQNHFYERQRPKYLFSGLTKCACCGGGYSMISTNLLGCSTARNKGTCANRANIRRSDLEARVLNALRHHLMAPALFKDFCDEFTREVNRQRIEARAPLEAARMELKRIERELDTLLNLILKGGAAEKINAKMVQLEARKADLVRNLAEAEEPPTVLHPEMASFYRAQVDALHEALGSDAETARLEAASVMRTLIKDIVLAPEGDQLKIDVRGDLAGILTIALDRKRPSETDGRAEQVKLVAGRGFEPLTFRL